ncbi:MAG: ATP-binding protein [Clostridia bacterium]|nr:ATP-binding protein [Clostridia bacterium]
MSFNRENYRRIRQDYETKYLRAREDADRRRSEAEAALPALRALDRELGTLGLELMRISMENAGNDAARQQALEALRTRNTELQALRAQILLSGGYPADYTDLRYECDRCSDTGYLDSGAMCSCMREKLVAAGYASSGLGALLREQRFDNYSLDYFRNDEKTYRTMSFVLQTLREYATSFTPGGEPEREASPNLLLVGGTGLGKTHLSTAVAKTVLDAGHDVLYASAVGLMGDFEMARFGNSAAGESGFGAESTARYFDCDLLIIDDLGTEVSNQFTTSCLYNVINTRLNLRRPTIISTNLMQDELRRRYWDRITSRLFGEYKILLFLGTDVRAQKVMKK